MINLCSPPQPLNDKMVAFPPRVKVGCAHAKAASTHLSDKAGVGLYMHGPPCVQPRPAVKHKHSRQRTKQQYTTLQGLNAAY